MATRRPAGTLASVADPMAQERAASVAAWAEDTAHQSATTTPGAVAAAESSQKQQQQLPFRPTATVTQHDAIRGTSVTLSIPLDEPAHPVRPSEPVGEAGQEGGGGSRQGAAAPAASHRPATPKKKILRRDSLERREALLRGKEGSRRRQRWENGHLLNNPWAEPPLPSDWEVQPTHPRTVVPYFLAPLWEADAHQRARRQSKAAKAKAKSTVEARASVLPRELRDKLKKAKSARGLLMDLETEVRRFIEDWNRRQAALERAGLDSVMEEDDDDYNGGGRYRKEENAIEDSSEDELVFVGRQGQMKDMPPSPKAKRRGRGGRKDSVDEVERPGTSGTTATILSSDDDDLVEIEAGGDPFIMPREKLVFGGPVADQGASFARWIVHSIGDYYGLRTWSVTVGDPARREAYVAIDTMKTGRGIGPLVKPLPQPLWGMV